jgi:hypothetical protein
MQCRQRSFECQAKDEETNVAEHGLVLNRASSLVDEPPGMAGLLFI